MSGREFFTSAAFGAVAFASGGKRFGGKFAVGLFACVLLGLPASGRVKCIAHGWDLLNVSPEEVLANADAFAETGLDGVTLMVRKGPISFSHGLPDDIWPTTARADLSATAETCRRIVRHRGLGESFLNTWWSPLKRLDWTDDAAWANFATNMSTAAWLARTGGLRGIFVDNEDYRKTRQYFWQAGDPPYDQALALARRRGREVFGAIFREYPDAVLLAFWLYTQENEWNRPAPDSLRQFAQDNRRLWPAFLDGMWDVIPPAARVVDGNEFGYNYIAAHGEYYRSACDQRVRFIRAAAPEHQAKCRAQLGVGFGMYLDNYVKGRSWRFYAGLTDDPVSDFRENLEQIGRATDDYVWIYGEKSVWIPWKGLKAKRWEQAPVWNKTLPGLNDVLRQATDLLSYVAESLAAGTATNLVTSLEKDVTFWQDPKLPKGDVGLGPKSLSATGANGAFLVSVRNVKAGERYAFRATAHGDARYGMVCWRTGGAWSWEKLPVTGFVEFGPAPAGGRRTGVALAQVPEGADELVLQLAVRLEAGERLDYSDIAVIRLRPMLRDMKAQPFLLRDAVVVYEDALDSGSSDPWRDWGRRGVEDLTNGIFRTTGASLPVVPESRAKDLTGRPVIYVGNTAAARAAGLDAGALANEDALIRVASDRAFIVARTGLGASAGCGRFLETQADYYMMTVSGDDPVTFDPTRRAQVGELAVRPAVPWRYFHFFTASRFPKTSKNLVDYGRRIRCMVNRECSEPITEAVKHAHTFFEFCRPEDFAATHPEYFSLGKDGKRHFTWNSNSQLCLSAPGLFDVVYSNLVRVVEKDRAMCREKGVRPSTVFEFSQMDSCGYMCWCPACTKVIEKYNRKKGGNWEGGDAALQLLFVNRLARKIRERYPDVRIRTFAYVSTEGAPEGIEVEPNVIIRLCDLYSKSDHMRPLESPFNAPRLKLIDDWFRLTKNIEIWDYRLYGGLTWEGVFPEVDVDAIAADTKLFVRYGLPRLFQQHHFENQPFFELNAFVESRFLTDPSADLGETIDRYCRVYGKGATAMRKAIDFFRGIIRDNPPASETDWHARLLPWRTVANMERLKGLVADAYARETPGTRAHGRVAEVLAAVEMELARLYQAVPGARTKLAEAKRDCERHYREGIVAGAVDPADREREMRTFLGILNSLGLVFEDIPAELKGVPKDGIFYLSLSAAYVPRSMNDPAIPDPTSEMGTVARWRPTAEPRLPLACAAAGCRTDGGSGPFAVEPAADGRWHWHRLGVVRISAGGRITVPAAGGPSFRLKDYYINCDGLATDPNWYEVWVSLKRVGEKLATGDKSKGLFVDRLILRRVLHQDQ